MGKILFLSYVASAKAKVNQIKNELIKHGYEIKDELVEGVNRTRVSILRSHAIILFVSTKSLLDNQFYQDYETIYKFNRGKTIIEVVLDKDIDSLYDSVYNDEEVTDEDLLRADDFRSKIERGTPLYLDENLMDDLLTLLGDEGAPEPKKAEEVKEEAKPEVKEEAKPEVKEEAPVEVKEETKEEPVAQEAQEEKVEEEKANEPVVEQKEEPKEEIKAEEKKEDKIEPLADSEVKEVKIVKLDRDALEKAIFKFSQEEYPEALSLFTQTSDDPVAQLYLGYMYQNGLGLPENDSFLPISGHSFPSVRESSRLRCHTS